jgi:hypothetical protein
MTTGGKTQAEALAALELILGVAPPPRVAALGTTHLAHLADAIEGARERHSRALSLALDEAFEQVPGLFRGAVKRIVVR